MRFQLRVRIKGIAIAKCDLFFDYSDTKEILFYYFCDKKLCAKHKKKTLEFHLYCRDHVCKVSKWSLVDRFHREFRVSTQIKVHNHCIAKYKMFSTCDGLLMAFWAIFLQFKIFTSIRTLQVFSFAIKKVQGFFSDRKILMSL